MAWQYMFQHTISNLHFHMNFSIFVPEVKKMATKKYEEHTDNLHGNICFFHLMPSKSSTSMLYNRYKEKQMKPPQELGNVRARTPQDVHTTLNRIVQQYIQKNNRHKMMKVPINSRTRLQNDCCSSCGVRGCLAAYSDGIGFPNCF